VRSMGKTFQKVGVNKKFFLFLSLCAGAPWTKQCPS
jgi:hypothetical protein